MFNVLRTTKITTLTVVFCKVKTLYLEGTGISALAGVPKLSVDHMITTWPQQYGGKQNALKIVWGP